MFYASEPVPRSDLRLIGRAARERWPIDDVYRAATAKRLIAIVLNPKERQADAVGAARVLASLDRLNLEQERLDLERQRGTPSNDYPDDVITEEQAERMRRAALREGELMQLESHVHDHSSVAAPQTPDHN